MDQFVSQLPFIPQLSSIKLEGVLSPFLDSVNSLQASTLQMIIVGVSVFLLILLLGFARHHMLEWSLKGAWFGIFFGMLIATVLLAGLFVGGRVLIVQVLQLQSIPPEVRFSVQKYLVEFSQALDVDTQTLGISAHNPTRQTIVYDYKQLSSTEQQDVRRVLCAP